MSRFNQALLLTLLLAPLGGCASSHIIVGSVRPAIAPAQVRLYLHAPAHYEEVAVLSTSSAHSVSFSAQGEMDVVIGRLKREAAALGANGILLEGVQPTDAGKVSASVGGAVFSSHAAAGVSVGTTTPRHRQSGRGIAIFVP